MIKRRNTPTYVQIQLTRRKTAAFYLCCRSMWESGASAIRPVRIICTSLPHTPRERT